jgi:hypothetical protein
MSTSGEYFGFPATSNATGYYSIVTGLGTDTYMVTASYSSDGNSGYGYIMGVSVTAGSETSGVNIAISVTPPAPSGIIMGKVTDSSNGNPIKGASVEADGGLAGSGTAVTDSNGNYVISYGLGTGTYNVTASAAGYNSNTITGVSVTVNQTTPNVNLQLSPSTTSGSISGTVTGASGAVPEFATTTLLFLTMATTAIALVFVKKRTSKGTQ